MTIMQKTRVDRLTLAIVIPYFKIEYFAETLESLARQSDKRFRVFVGDDASAENPRELIERFGGMLDLTYKRFEKNLGSISLSRQWERCLELVPSGRWVHILGDDDIVDVNFVAAFHSSADKIEASGAHVVRFASRVIDEKSTPISPLYTHPELEGSVEFLMRKLRGGTRSSLSEYVFDLDTLRSKGFRHFPLGWHSDFFAVLDISGFGTVYTINEAGVGFRKSALNITSRRDNLALKGKASLDFYYILLRDYAEKFDSDMRLVLLEKLESVFLENKRNLRFWFKLIFLYMRFKEFSRLFGFSVQYAWSIINRVR